MIYPSARCWTLPAWRRQTLQITPTHGEDLFFSDAEVFVAPSYFFQLRNHPTKRQTDEANAHELLLLVTAKNRGSTLWRSVFVWKRAINAWKGYFWNANRALMIQRWAQGKSFRCPAFIISFCFFFPFSLSEACWGCFMHATLQGRTAKRDDLTQEKPAFWGGGGHGCMETSSHRSEVCRFIRFAVLSSTPQLTAPAHDVYTH